MKPPYDITPAVFRLATEIAMKIGQLDASLMTLPALHLRKENRIKTIQSSLAIEGNTLSLDQVTALIDRKRVVGPQKDILEVLNAIKVYENISGFVADSAESYLAAHKMLMEGLLPDAGRYRTKQVGVFQGSQVAHIAPPAKNVHYIMADLFAYVKNENELTLLKSCVFHYEMEFIHPFPDGNGRMGRLWQTVILMREYPVFEFLPFETLISLRQQEYYAVLAECGRQGKSTLFIEFMLDILDKSLAEMLNFNNRNLNYSARLEYFIASGKRNFSRRDYMNVFKDISTATASRDLKKGVDDLLFTKEGDKNKTVYKIK
jgi:Fic family protein